jgi:hypothetical protein
MRRIWGTYIIRISIKYDLYYTTKTHALLKQLIVRSSESEPRQSAAAAIE